MATVAPDNCIDETSICCVYLFVITTRANTIVQGCQHKLRNHHCSWIRGNPSRFAIGVETLKSAIGSRASNHFAKTTGTTITEVSILAHTIRHTYQYRHSASIPGRSLAPHHDGCLKISELRFIGIVVTGTVGRFGIRIRSRIGLGIVINPRIKRRGGLIHTTVKSIIFARVIAIIFKIEVCSWVSSVGMDSSVGNVLGPHAIQVKTDKATNPTYHCFFIHLPFKSRCAASIHYIFMEWYTIGQRAL